MSAQAFQISKAKIKIEESEKDLGKYAQKND